VTSSTVSVTVGNLSVTMSSPTGGNVTHGATVSLQSSPVSASSITKVDYYVNGAHVCTGSSNPYSCNWKVPATLGTTYNIYARAYDSSGSNATSPTVTVTSQ